MDVRLVLGLLLLSLSCLARAEEQVFDVHVHIWEGEKSLKEYLGQLASTGQPVSRFGAIHMARRGQLEHTRKKNDELIALAER